MIVFIGIVVGAIVLVREYMAIRRNHAIKMINIFGMMYGLTYGLLPASFWIAHYITGDSIGRIDYSINGEKQLLVWMALAIIGYILISFFYRIKIKNNNVCYVTSYSNEELQLLFKKLDITALICLIIGIITFLLWTRAYGGVISFIMRADQIRSGRGGVHNSFAFFSHFARILSISAYIYLYLIKQKYHIYRNAVLFVVSFVASTLYYLADDGRMSAAMFLCVLLFIYIGIFDDEVKVQKKVVYTLIIGLIAMTLIMNLDAITGKMRYGIITDEYETSFVNRVLKEFSYIIVSAQATVRQLMNGGSPLLLIQDILNGLFAWLPTAFKPSGLINIWDYNSMLINPSSIAQTPCDYITTSIYDASIFGVLLFSLFWGITLKKIDSSHVKNQHGFGVIAYYALSMSVLRLVNYCMLYDTILSLFALFLALCVWRVVKKMKIQM